MPGAAKSMEAMAAVLEPEHVSRRHQSIQHFVSEARWSDEALRARVRAAVLPAMQRRAPIAYWITDDTTVPKSGRHSVGVDYQYSSAVKAVINCQALVSLSLSNGATSLPVACELYLPEAWAGDRRRRLHAGVPAALGFRTKIAVAVQQIQWAVAAGLPRGLVLADGAYGSARAYRDGVRAGGLDYAVAVEKDLSVVPVAAGPRGPTRRPHRAATQAGAVAVAVLAGELPATAWHELSLPRDGHAPVTGRFAALRVRTAPAQERDHLGPEEWLLIEAPRSPQDRWRYWLASLPAATPLAELVRHAKERCRIEQDYRELKQEVGLARFEGRSWRGVTHHLTLCLAAYGFLVRERSLFPPRRPAAGGPPGPPSPALAGLPPPAPRP